jgi:hypothetical protein
VEFSGTPALSGPRRLAVHPVHELPDFSSAVQRQSLSGLFTIVSISLSIMTPPSPGRFEQN